MARLKDYEDRVKRASDTDWARLAAFIDGEGTIYINRAARSRAEWSPRHSLCVVVTNSSPALITWLHETFGGSVYTRSSPPSALSFRTKRQMWGWQLNQRMAYTILGHCLPWMIIKREQCRLGLEFIELLKAAGNNRGKKVTQEAIEGRDEFRRKIHVLNQGHSFVDKEVDILAMRREEKLITEALA